MLTTIFSFLADLLGEAIVAADGSTFMADRVLREDFWHEAASFCSVAVSINSSLLSEEPDCD